MGALERKNYRTSRGDVPLWGVFEEHDPARPVLLLIRGAFAGAEDWTVFISAFPQADVVLAHLPGMHSPFLRRSSIGDFAKAFDEVIARAFQGRRVVVVGLSMGGLVALSLQAEPVGGIIACDPPLSTDRLWPLIDMFRGNLADQATSPDLCKWITNLFGLTLTDVANVDYRPLLDALRFKVDIIIGGVPLEPARPLDAQPGLMTQEDRAFVIAHPMVRSLVVPGGHNVPRAAPWQVVAVVNRALHSLTAPAAL